MIFKYFLIATLGFIFYKMILPKKKIESSETEKSLNEEYTDYEEIEE